MPYRQDTTGCRRAPPRPKIGHADSMEQQIRVLLLICVVAIGRVEAIDPHIALGDCELVRNEIATRRSYRGLDADAPLASVG
jgi:hypothetical protein